MDKAFLWLKTHLKIGRSENRNCPKKNEIGMGHKNCSDSANIQVILLL